MYSLLKMGIFHCYVCLPECNFYDPLIKHIVRPYFLLGWWWHWGWGHGIHNHFLLWMIGSRTLWFFPGWAAHVCSRERGIRDWSGRKDRKLNPAFLHQNMVLLENGSARWWNTRRLYKCFIMFAMFRKLLWWCFFRTVASQDRTFSRTTNISEVVGTSDLDGGAIQCLIQRHYNPSKR